MTRFGSFAPLCKNVPSYPWCNLFFSQLLKRDPSLVPSDTTSTPIGINPVCGIARIGHGSVGNIANIVACAVCIIFMLAIVVFSHRRKAAVGRIEIRTLFMVYLVSLPLQLISTGAILRQGSKALTAVTAVHAGIIAALFAALLANAIISTQVVEDGTPSSMIPFVILMLIFFIATTYISLDTGFQWTKKFGPSNPPLDLVSIPIFVFTSIWPALAALLYFGIMIYVVIMILQETKPLWFFILAGVLFVLSQLDFFLLSKVICNGTGAKVDGTFIATLLETACMGVLFFAWKSITEDTWEDDTMYGRP